MPGVERVTNTQAKWNDGAHEGTIVTAQGLTLPQPVVTFIRASVAYNSSGAEVLTNIPVYEVI